jgi:hypothetical protein
VRYDWDKLEVIGWLRHELVEVIGYDGLDPWLATPRDDLGGRTPLQAVDDGDFELAKRAARRKRVGDIDTPLDDLEARDEFKP